MPNIKSAKKKLRQDIKRRKHNAEYEKKLEKALRVIAKTKEKKQEVVNKAFSLIDKAAKRKVIHKNKAARLKARVSKLFAKRDEK